MEKGKNKSQISTVLRGNVNQQCRQAFARPTVLKSFNDPISFNKTGSENPYHINLVTKQMLSLAVNLFLFTLNIVCEYNRLPILFTRHPMFFF